MLLFLADVSTKDIVLRKVTPCSREDGDWSGVFPKYQ